MCTSRTMRIVSCKLITRRAMHTASRHLCAEWESRGETHTGGRKARAPRPRGALPQEPALPISGVPMAVASSVSDTMIRKTEYPRRECDLEGNSLTAVRRQVEAHDVHDREILGRSRLTA